MQHFSQITPDQRTQLAQQFPPEYNADPNDPSSMAQPMARAGKERPDVAQRILSHVIRIFLSTDLSTEAANCPG